MILGRWREEEGAALGLVAILVVVIGVMAAGLLAVVRADLEGAIQANRGERALYSADAGAQAAAALLRADAAPEHYDAASSGNSGWAAVPPDGGPPGETLGFGEDAATVTVEYLLPARTAAHQRQERYAPERVPAGHADYPDKDFFLVASEGASGGARRKVEVIVCAERSGDRYSIAWWSWREVHG